MSDERVFLIPSRIEMEQADAEGFALQVTADTALPVTLLEVCQGVAMNVRYECYSLMFGLPTGTTLPQAVYRLLGPGGKQWTLLMTPILSGPGSLFTLEAVIHRELQAP
ncbi:DUF6916 family protein [Pseudomonas rubra]|uniref:DUF6916 domain-containing protein n=1 Tax=Pseudomonas rubra TaxID=2942627 RepID=A0ABT5P3I0_9PSED|nr:hypothetical protein [Pseudomonas rubra]MDD1012707.1 hypothetical protein [Pseudomonas rubra]MDD1041585.1 hypothetical protein [Pseudomonas rubra]MDD1155521.1 hypothetical protein [Pseudomonas rubra]